MFFELRSFKTTLRLKDLSSLTQKFFMLPDVIAFAPLWSWCKHHVQLSHGCSLGSLSWLAETSQSMHCSLSSNQLCPAHPRLALLQQFKEVLVYFHHRLFFLLCLLASAKLQLDQGCLEELGIDGVPDVEQESPLDVLLAVLRHRRQIGHDCFVVLDLLNHTSYCELRTGRNSDVGHLGLEEVLLLAGEDFLEEVHGTVPERWQVDLA